MEIAILALVATSIITYLASRPQHLLPRRIPSLLAWPTFIGLIFISSYLLFRYYSLTAASLMIISAVMFGWVAFVLKTDQIRYKLIPFSCLGAVAALAVAQTMYI